MNAPTSKIEPMADFDLTALMIRDGIRSIERWSNGSFTVHLIDGGYGIGPSVGEALAKALVGKLAA